MEEIKALVPEGYRDVLSLDTSRPARLCIGRKWWCNTAYKVKVRGMATKIPGWFFTAYQSAQFYGQQLISEVQMRAILEGTSSRVLKRSLKRSLKAITSPR